MTTGKFWRGVNLKGQQYSDDIRTRYEHLDSYSIADQTKGGTVNTILGIGGNTGSASTAEHLHLDVSTEYKSPWLDLVSRQQGFDSYYKISSADGYARYYYSPELFNSNYNWKVNDANVYECLKK